MLFPLFQGIPVATFPEQYAKRFKEPLLKPNCGFEKVEELVESMNKLVYLGDDENGVKCIKPTLYRVEDWEKAQRRNGKTYSVAIVVPQRIQIHLEDMMQKYQDGLRMDMLLETYEKEYDERISLKDYGCMSVLEFCTVLKNIFNIEKLNDHNSTYFMVYPIWIKGMSPEPVAQVWESVKKRKELPTDLLFKIQKICFDHKTGIRVDMLQNAFEVT